MNPSDPSLLQRILIEKRLLNKIAKVQPGIQRSPGPKPLSFAQEGLWYYEQLAPRSALYVIPRAFRIRGALNLSAIQKALQFVVARHESLRSRIAVIDGQPQTTHEEQNFTLNIVDLGATKDEAERERRIQERLNAEGQSGFDLRDDWLVRATLMRDGPDDHTLLLVLHHIISDYLSLEILYDELGKAYESFHRFDKPPELPPLPSEFADLAAFEKRKAEEKGFASELEYWREQLRSHPSEVEFPADYPRPAVRSFRGSHFHFRLPAELTNGLKRLSREHKVTLHHLLLAAFKVLLFRYSNYEDIPVGIPMSRRELPGAEKLIGFFINTLPLHTGLTSEMNVAELVAAVNNAAAELYVRGQIPFVKLARECCPTSDLSRHPLFQIVFQYFSDPPTKPRFQDTDVEALFVETGTAKFDLTVTIVDDPDGLSGEVEYATDLYAKPSIERMVGHFQSLLQGIVSKPSQRLSALPLLSNSEEEALVVRYNQTQTNYPRDATIHELFEGQCRRTPRQIALRMDNVALTYEELNRRANQMARFLEGQGSRPGDRIGVCLERSVEMVVCLLATLKVGGSYVPLDPRYPKERIEFLARDANLTLILASSRSLASPPDRTRLIQLENVAAEISQLPSEDVGKLVRADGPAYLIYTSGSTGEPKGVVVPHRGVVRLVKETNYVQIAPAETFLQFAPLSFDASTFEIWGSLLNGATLAIFPPSFDSIEQLGAVLDRCKVSTLWLTAGLFHEIVDHHIEVLKPVRKLLAGGEALSSRHVAKLVQRFPDCELINGYGPTENTTFTCCYRIPNNWNGSRPVPIGRPISNTTVYILDKQLRPVPVGVPGELFTGGDGVALGYLNHPQLTEQKFIPNPFDPAGGKIYRTGDTARYLPDGNIEFLGRRDHQVKIRGFRVELEEIEHTLHTLSMVKSAVVLTDRNESGGQTLVAFVISESAQPSEALLREELTKKLPAYMVPSRIVFVTSIPTTANGKVDRHALGQLKPIEAKPASEEPPTNSFESRLRAIWCEVLGIESVGRRDNFFQLGGHSLLATRVISRINHEFRRGLSLSVLFEAPTIAELAHRIETAGAGVPPPIVPRSRQRTKANPDQQAVGVDRPFAGPTSTRE